MNERYLFRGKRMGDRKWIEGCLEYHTITGPAFIRVPKHIHWDVDMVFPSTIGQYTGLKDKNGNLIFEGDILEVDSEDGYFILEWDDDQARFVMNGDGLTVTFDNYWPYQTEVIGNIHDNPELLEDKLYEKNE